MHAANVQALSMIFATVSIYHNIICRINGFIVVYWYTMTENILTLRMPMRGNVWEDSIFHFPEAGNTHLHTHSGTSLAYNPK